VFHQYTLQLDGIDRNKLSEFLATKNIPSMIYYPIPAHKQKMFAAFNCENQDLPVTDWLTERVLSLPIHTELEEDQLKYICSAIQEFMLKMGKIAVVGTGYVGLVTGTCFAETGNQVICIDIDAKKVERMRNGEIPIYEPHLDVFLNETLKQID
jgi:hypothetical protein